LYLFVEKPLERIGRLLFEKKEKKSLVFKIDEGVEDVSDGL